MFKKVAKCIIHPILWIIAWIIISIWTLIIRLSPAEKVEDHYYMRLDYYIARMIIAPFEILIPESEVYKKTVNGKEYSFIDVKLRGSQTYIDANTLASNWDDEDDTGYGDTYVEHVEDVFKICGRVLARMHNEEL